MMTQGVQGKVKVCAEDRQGEAVLLRIGLARFLSAGSVVVGVGNRDCGDDGFGPVVIDLLRGRINIPIIDAGLSPENYLGRIAAWVPKKVLFLDAADLGRSPGSLALSGMEALVCAGAGTHAASLALAAQYLHTAVGAESLGLLAQPLQVRYQPACSAVCGSEGIGESRRPASIHQLSRPVRAAALWAARLILAATCDTAGSKDCSA